MYSASLFDQAFDALGPAGLTDALRSIRLADHMAEPPEGYEDLTAYEALPQFQGLRGVRATGSDRKRPGAANSGHM